MRTRKREWLFTAGPVVLGVLLIVSIGSVAAGELRRLGASPVSGSAAAVSSPEQPLAAGVAQRAVDQVDSLDLGVQFGVGVLDRVSGAETLGSEGATTFYSASVIKLFLVADLFHQQEAGQLTLSSEDLSDIDLALRESDDQAMDALWEQDNGPVAISQLVSLAHLQDTVVPSDINETGEWGETLISARDVLAVYQYVLTQLAPADRDRILSDLNTATAQGADGFDQSFGLLGPVRTAQTKAKQGWMSYDDQVMLHSTGILDANNQVVVALLSEQPGAGSAADFATARQDLDRAADVLVTALTPAD